MVLEGEFQKLNIDIPANNIMSRMRSLIRSYFRAKNCKVQQKKWKFYKSMAKIMKFVPRSKDTKRLSLSSENDSSSDETAKLIDEKRNDKSTNPYLARQSKQKKKYNSNRKTVKRVWTLKDEKIFLEVWKRFARTPQSEKPSAGLSNEMELDLFRQGMKVTLKEIRSKRYSFTRRFRKCRNSNNAEKWAHYNAVLEILEPWEAITPDQLNENIACSCGVEIFNDEECLDINPWKETHDNLSDDDIDVVSVISVLSEHSNNTQISTALSERVESVTPDLNESELDNMLKDISTFNICAAEKSTEISPKPQLAKEFGELVTKELSLLSDNLLIEAKRQMYNIICVMQKKQLQADKTAQKNE